MEEGTGPDFRDKIIKFTPKTELSNEPCARQGNLSLTELFKEVVQKAHLPSTLCSRLRTGFCSPGVETAVWSGF